MTIIETMMLEIADKINSTKDAIDLAKLALNAYKAGTINLETLKVVIGTCADCADDCDGATEYFMEYNKAIVNIF